MKILKNPDAETLAVALKRPQFQVDDLEKTIAGIFDEVKKDGDRALRSFTSRFDGIELQELRVNETEWSLAESLISEELKAAIRIAAENIERFHRSQQLREPVVETMPGVVCWRKSVPVSSVGLYIPGGSAPLFSTVLMLGIPAAIAGCGQRILCTPPAKDGSVNPAILYAARVAGITEVFRTGGAQAIAAMTYGTDTIPEVDKLFGPGNQYVTAAKQYAQRFGKAIDLPAGPSEVLVAADQTVPAEFIAADLLAQAEHGADSQVIFVTDSDQLLENVLMEIEKQLADLPRAEIAAAAIQNSTAIVVAVEQWATIINEYAPEHLILSGKYEDWVVKDVINTGSVFLGINTAESFGDYASGTNHTLPTAGFARAYSGVSLDSFVKKITFQRIEDAGLSTLGPVIVQLAEAEQLRAHANAVTIRLNRKSLRS